MEEEKEKSKGMSDQVKIALIMIVPATLLALSTLIVSVMSLHQNNTNASKIDTLHHVMNSALTKRVEEAKDLGNKTGNLEGRKEQTQERKEEKKK